MPRQLEQTPRCCNKAFVGFPRVSGSDSFLPEEAHSTGLPTSPRERCCTAASKVFLRAKKLWVNPPKAERAKPSLSSDYNLLFKNKIGESSLDIHRLRIIFATRFISGMRACISQLQNALSLSSASSLVSQF